MVLGLKELKKQKLTSRLPCNNKLQKQSNKKGKSISHEIY